MPVLRLITTLMEISVTVAMFVYAFRSRLRFSPWKLAAIILALFALVAWMFRVPAMQAQFFDHNQILSSLVFMAACLGLILCSFRASVWQLVYILFIVQAYYDNCWQTVRLLWEWWGERFFSSREVFFLCGLFALHLLTFPLILNGLRRFLDPLLDQEDASPFWKYLCVLPIAHYLIFRFGISPNYMNPQAEAQWTIQAAALCLGWFAVTFFSYVIQLAMLTQVFEKHRLAQRLSTQSLQRGYQQERFKALANRIAETRALRHDLRHHMLVIESLTLSQSYEKLTAYVHQLAHPASLPEASPLCQNAAVDAVVSFYLQQARQAGADLTVSIQLPPVLPVDELDLCVILGNLLENAAQACQRQEEGRRFVQVAVGSPSPSALSISIQNSFTGGLVWDKGALVSSQRGGPGVGTESVRRLVKRYGGLFRLEADGKVCCATVALMAPMDQGVVTDGPPASLDTKR